MLVAVTVTVCWLATIAGARYTPLVIVPTAGFRDHVTVAFELPLTSGVKVALWPPSSSALPGDKLRLTEVRVMVAVAVLVGSSTLATVSVTVCGLPMDAGAV
jgi:hypothetical protein